MIKTAEQLGREAAQAYLEKRAFWGLLAGAARTVWPAARAFAGRLFGQRAGMTAGQRVGGALTSPGLTAATMAPELASRTREIKAMNNPNQWKSTAKEMMPQGVTAANQLR